MPDPSSSPPWVTSKSSQAMQILDHARQTRRPVVLLLGAGVSVDAGIPLASQLKEYLTQIHQMVREEGFTNARQYVEELRWPSRHDLRVDLLLKGTERSLLTVMPQAERVATQAAMLSEMRRNAPMLAASLNEIFGQLDPAAYNRGELQRLYGSVADLAQSLGRRSPRNIAYRSLLFHLCDRNQTTIDACLDHFMRDRSPATPHQFLYFLTQSLNCRVILTTNFDQLLEMAFAGEGLLPRVYEVHGEGSIPSGQLLLSQPLSIVKLHGGAHQLRTGFDLDDPLSPAALSTFADLFRQLQPAGGDPPLIVALGYSGSDRRVMDIVTNHIRDWRADAQGKAYRPRVLWVSRDPWPPELLNAAVRTHPEVLQNGDTATRADQFPAHLVRYREGRMFLFEAIQRLRGHFPIARSNYQAVNFVQHTTEGDGMGGPVPDGLKDGDSWRIALIHAPKSGGGSSSALVALADHLERHHETRTIWIDLTEVVGVAALMDVLSERMVKLDSRLQPIRRPPVLQSLRDPQPENTLALKRSRRHEILTAAQWLRHALRRGRYMIALDSLDEFPCCHPALPETDDRFEAGQRGLLLDLIQELLDDPSLIGDSRIALALSDDGPSDSRFHKLIDAFQIKSQGLRDIRYYVHLGESSPVVALPPCYKERFIQFFHVPEDLRSQMPSKGTPLDGLSLQYYHRALAGLVVLVSACARRIRSEVMLTRCVSELLGRLLRSKLQTEAYAVDCDLLPENELRKWVFEALVGDDFMSRIQVRLKAQKEGEFDIWMEYSRGEQHKTDLGFPQLDRDIVGALQALVGYNSATGEGPGASTVVDGATTDLPRPDKDRRWIYRTEGGYHWMHRDVRNGLYEKLRNWDKADQAALPTDSMNRVLAATHHTIALFSYDELYERSRDARSFLEYMFHRIAAIRLAVHAKMLKCVCGWVHRLVLALHREKHALLTRVRLPGLIRMVTQLADELADNQLEVFEGQDDPEDYRSKVVEYRDDLHSLLSQFFLASGHPHSAFDSLCQRVKPVTLKDAAVNVPPAERCQRVGDYLAAELERRRQAVPFPSTDRPKRQRRKPADPVPINDEQRREERRTLRVFRDLASACQDPILSRVKFPSLGTGADPLADWPDRYVEAGGLPAGSVHRQREARLGIARTVYELFIDAESKADRSSRLEQDWSESDDDGDLVMGIIRRMLEFRLTQYPTAWVGSAEVYWDRGKGANDSDASRYRDILTTFRREVAAIKEKLDPDESPELYDKAALLRGSDPILRSSDRRRRNECHRLCLSARLKMAEKFGTQMKSDTLLLLDQAWWPRIRLSLESAEAILSRNGDPADRQAMAITRLTSAELRLRMAETHQLAYDNARLAQAPMSNEQMKARDKHHDLAKANYAEAVTLLSTVESLLNEGRGENRWRFFYLLTRSRSHMFKALTLRDDSRRQAQLELHWAARHLVGATSNCGLWTDRYDLLGWWWDTWQSLAKGFFPNQPQQFKLFMRDIKARLGIRWFRENYARRDDRWEVVS
jgi:hypothetical protein